MGRPLEEARLEKLARAILGVGAEQAKAELASGEISDTPAGEAFAIVLAQGRVIEAARAAAEEVREVRQWHAVHGGADGEDCLL